jgi:hypothetical protein
MIFLLSITQLVVLANGLAFKGPRQTSTSEDEADFLRERTPIPTPKPEPFQHLGKRAGETTEQLGFQINDNTCGYLGGSLGMENTTSTFTSWRMNSDPHQERPLPAVALQLVLRSRLAQEALSAVLTGLVSRSQAVV